MNLRKIQPKMLQKIIWFNIFLIPIFDVITSFSIHFLGSSMLFILGMKFFFLIFLFVLNLLYFDKKSMFYSLITGIYFLLFFLILFFCQGSSVLFINAQNLFRTFYFPFCFLFLNSLQRKGIFQIKIRYLCYLLFLYLFFLVVPELFHLGFNSYAYSKVGGLGWYYSTNEISGILAILGPFLFLYLKDKSWFLRIFLFCFYLGGIFVLGTKVPVLAFLITVFGFLISYLVQLWRKKEWKKVGFLVGSSCTFFLVFCFLLISSSFYKNIKIHLDFLEIHSVSDLMTFHHIDHFIFSERLSFLQDTHEIYQKKSLPEKMLGMGIAMYDGEVISMKMVEMDYFDIFYHYGVVGFSLFFLPIFLISWKRKYLLEERISMFLIFLLAFFSGHILVAPSVGVISILVLIKKDGVVE